MESIFDKVSLKFTRLCLYTKLNTEILDCRKKRKLLLSFEQDPIKSTSILNKP